MMFELTLVDEITSCHVYQVKPIVMASWDSVNFGDLVAHNDKGSNLKNAL